MAKYNDWIVPDKLELIRAWARDGMTDEEIAKKIGINRTTMYDWKKRFPDFADALKNGKEIVDIGVENSLLKRTQGYNVPIKKTFKVKVIDYDPDTGRKLQEREELATGIDEVHVPADTTAMIFWLKNRLPEKWRDKPDGESGSNLTIVIKDDYGDSGE